MALQSPLSQQARPDAFKPKVVGLYERLFEREQLELTEGFWREFFLLRPDESNLSKILDSLRPEDILQHEATTQELFHRAVEQVARAERPADEHALDTLTVFLESILQKKYTNPSSDIITVVAGLDYIDAVFTEFVATLEKTIKDGRTLDTQQKAVRVGLATVTGVYQTGLVSYFVNRDLFPSLIKLVQDADNAHRLFGPFALLGLLGNYAKFEFQNPYQLRMADYLDEDIMRKLGDGLADVYVEARNKYLAIQDDQPEAWSMGSALSYLSIRSGGRAAHLSEDQAKIALSDLPSLETAITLPLYDFVNANKQFCLNLVSVRQKEKQEPSCPLSSFLSFSSYLLQNAHRSSRASLYSCLNVLVLQILVEDPAVAMAMCSSENMATIRLCRQRQPFLPLVRGERSLAAVLMDVALDGVNHNLRRRLDTDLYVRLLGLQLRLLSVFGRARVRLAYHWAELWRSLLSFMRFLNSYAETLKSLMHVDELAGLLIKVLALALSTGETFLPDAKSYDDLFYKVFESGDEIVKFRDNFGLAKGPSAGPVGTLVHVSSHYKTLLEEQNGKGNKSLSPREVTKVIKEGYETLSIQATEGLDHWDKYREADHRNLIKKITRIAVQDIKDLLAERKERGT